MRHQFPDRGRRRQPVVAGGNREDIIERTDGIPLFAEEMTKAVLDAEGESDVQRTFAGAPPPAVTVPASLQASLMSRLDRLGPAKHVAQVGAASAGNFPTCCWQRSCKAEGRTGLRPRRLIAAGLLFRQGIPPHANYLFKHALVQDVAYSTLLREPRRALHARIAETLESQFPEIAESQPELLARHYTKADLIEKSAQPVGQGGTAFTGALALAEAENSSAGPGANRNPALYLRPAARADHFTGRALEHAHACQRIWRARNQGCRGSGESLIEQAERLGETPDDPSLLLSALFGQWIVNFINFNGDVARELAARFLALGEKDGSGGTAHDRTPHYGEYARVYGDLVDAKAHYDEALALYRPAEHRRLMTRFGQDLRVTCLAFRSMASWLLGYPEAALNDADRALMEARQIEHAATLMFTLNFPILINTYCGNYHAANEHLKELVVLAEEKGAPFRKAEGVLRRGYILTLTGAANAVEIVTAGIDLWRSAGSTIFTPEHEFMLAIAHVNSGQFDHAWRCIDKAMTVMQATKERWCEAEAHRVAGEIALKSPQRDEAKAQAHFERSLAIARAQHAKSWELRTATSLARLLRDQGKRQTARDLLAPIYDWFTEGFDTGDLRKAKAFLRELRSVPDYVPAPA